MRLLTINFIEGQAPSDGYGGLDSGEYILLGIDGKLHAIGGINTNGGVCDCCSDSIPEHIAYAVLNEGDE